MVEISVVSGTYNRLKHLKRMVESVRNSVDGISYEIILVDGGSTDGTLEWCRQQSDVVLIGQGELLGAIKAFNAGCARASGEYVAILNDDILVNGKTLSTAHRYLEENPHVGQAAFYNITKIPNPHRPPLGIAYGYFYGQCCMTRRWLGDLVGWWGNDGMHTYGGDTRLSMVLWELGWSTSPVQECSITDYVIADQLRKDRDKEGGPYHDGAVFHRKWIDRLPEPEHWIPAAVPRILHKATRGTLRTLRFKIVQEGYEPRTSLSKAFSMYGPSIQVNQSSLIRYHGPAASQTEIVRRIKEFQPDLVMFQVHSDGGGIRPRTIRKLRQDHSHTMFMNYNGDYRPNVGGSGLEVARAVHLQLICTPDLFDQYTGASVAWWLNGFEEEYGAGKRELDSGSPDVVFLANLYPAKSFPEAATRYEAVKALTEANISLNLYGSGWEGRGLQAAQTGDDHELNTSIYSRAKMALSISATKDAWGYTSDRLFMIGATGCPIVVQAFAGMDALGYIDGENCIAWSTIGEMVDKVKYFLEHPDERERIGLAGRQTTLAMHSYEARIRSLFAMLGEL